MIYPDRYHTILGTHTYIYIFVFHYMISPGPASNMTHAWCSWGMLRRSMVKWTTQVEIWGLWLAMVYLMVIYPLINRTALVYDQTNSENMYATVSVLHHDKEWIRFVQAITKSVRSLLILHRTTLASTSAEGKWIKGRCQLGNGIPENGEWARDNGNLK